MKIELEQIMNLCSFLEDYKDKNITDEVMIERYGFPTDWLNTEQAIHSFLIHGDIIPVKELWGDDLYKAFSAHISDDGWLTCSWETILEKEISRFDENYNDNPLYTGTYSRMYNTDFIESSCGKYIRPEIIL